MAVYLASIPALITSVNATLKKSADINVQIKEILQGVRRHITVVFDKTAEEEESKAALDEVLKGFKTMTNASHVLERETYSILKFNTVPTITNDGCPVTAELAAACLSKHPEWKKACPLKAPRFTHNKANPDSQ